MNIAAREGTPVEVVDDTKVREAQRAHWMSVETTPLSVHPSDPALAGRAR